MVAVKIEVAFWDTSGTGNRRFGVAAELAGQEIPWETPRLIQLRERLFAQLLIPQSSQQAIMSRLPHHVSFYVQFADGEKSVAKHRAAELGWNCYQCWICLP